MARGQEVRGGDFGVHWEGEGEVARAVAGPALVSLEHGGLLGAPAASLRPRAAGHGAPRRLRPLRVLLRRCHGLVVEVIEVRPAAAAGVEVDRLSGSVDAEQRLVGRHAPLGLRHRRPRLEHGRRDPVLVEPLAPGHGHSNGGVLINLRHRLDLSRLLHPRERRRAAAVGLERVCGVDGRPRQFL
jgi:hypothetical protein